MMTGLILKIESNKIAELLSIQFYIERENAITIYKNDLIKVYKNDEIEYYAVVDANRLRRGHLIARAEFADKEIMYPEGIRPVVVSGFTGYTIPCMGEGNTIYCGGYTVSFEKVSDIPKSDAVIHYGVTTDDFDRIDLTALAQAKEIKEIEVSFNAGEKVVILIPQDREERAYKDNGFGGKIHFSTTIMGINGDIKNMDDGRRYKVFGEFMTVDGKLKIYIE